MISDKMVGLVKNSSVIRAMFEEGKRLAGIYGAENVFDFSLGNPSVMPPAEIKEALLEVINEENPNLVHGYMNNSGYEDVREKIAESINHKFGTAFHTQNIIMTVGAAGGLNVILKTLLNPGDEVIVFAPFFGEYRNYVSNFDGQLVIIAPNTVDFQPNLVEFEQKITQKTKAVIVNTPNNPTGVVYSKKTIMELAAILNKKQKEFGNSIYLISDEPYRELAYDGVEVPYLTSYYNNTIVGYSYSKSLSLPGERIGYLVIPNETDDFNDVVEAANVANRILGYVNAPSLIQRTVAKCLEAKVDVEIYNRNRELLYNNLVSYGYQCVKPQGAFYLFVKALEENDKAFSEAAKNHNLLIVPGSSFGCPGYCRIAYCVDYEMIERSLPKFKLLAQEYGL
ncbi:MAG TPA: pyridoxal phosphate-dependent aminotransferase [Mobilitalea sp.]|nr:pyridoxal phosphate-dependent aminotransferase [Mobilitalea sp.]